MRPRDPRHTTPCGRRNRWGGLPHGSPDPTALTSNWELGKRKDPLPQIGGLSLEGFLLRWRGGGGGRRGVQKPIKVFEAYLYYFFRSAASKGQRDFHP